MPESRGLRSCARIPREQTGWTRLSLRYCWQWAMILLMADVMLLFFLIFRRRLPRRERVRQARFTCSVLTHLSEVCSMAVLIHTQLSFEDDQHMQRDPEQPARAQSHGPTETTHNHRHCASLPQASHLQCNLPGSNVAEYKKELAMRVLGRLLQPQVEPELR